MANPFAVNVLDLNPALQTGLSAYDAANKKNILANAPSGSLAELAQYVLKTTGDPQMFQGLAALGINQGQLSLAQLQADPNYIANVARAKAQVEQEFAPKTANFKLPGGDELTLEKGPGGYRVPTVQGLPTADPNQPLPPPGVDAKKWRENRATQLSNIDDKRVNELDTNAKSLDLSIRSMEKALSLNDKAFYGPYADKRGYAASLVGHEGGEATTLMQNLVLTQALEGLKASFGQNPTEGERKILVDLQASVSQPPKVRKELLSQALEYAKEKRTMATTNAEKMRQGTYLLPQNQQPAAAPAAAGGGDPVSQARAAISRGAPRDAVIQRLQQNGIQPPPDL